MKERQFLFCRISTGFPVIDLRHCLYWAHNLISKELRSTTAIIRFLFYVKVGRPEQVVYSSTKLGQNSKKKDNLGFVVTPYGIKEKKTIHRLAHFPHYYHYPGPGLFFWLLQLGFVARVIALWHGTLPLFDATKCRLCLRRLLRGFFLVICGNSPDWNAGAK